MKTQYEYKRLWYSDVLMADWAIERFRRAGWESYKGIRVGFNWRQFGWAYTFVIKRGIEFTTTPVIGKDGCMQCPHCGRPIVLKIQINNTENTTVE